MKKERGGRMKEKTGGVITYLGDRKAAKDMTTRKRSVKIENVEGRN